MAADQFVFEDSTGTIARLTGTLHDPAATVGDVLTVQSDKSIKAAPGGGSQPWRKFDFAFDTADILIGAALWTPPVGTFLSGGYPSLLISITTAFNGTTPNIEVGVIVSGTFHPLGLVGAASADPAATANAVPTSYNDVASDISIGTSYAVYQTGTDPIGVRLSDGAGGDPGSTVGSGRIVFPPAAIPA